MLMCIRSEKCRVLNNLSGSGWGEGHRAALPSDATLDSVSAAGIWTGACHASQTIIYSRISTCGLTALERKMSTSPTLLWTSARCGIDKVTKYKSIQLLTVKTAHFSKWQWNGRLWGTQEHLGVPGILGVGGLTPDNIQDGTMYVLTSP